MFNLKRRWKAVEERFDTIDRVVGAIADLLIDKGIITQSEVQSKIMENALSKGKRE